MLKLVLCFNQCFFMFVFPVEKPFYLLSVMKSGTHLMVKTLEALNNRKLQIKPFDVVDPNDSKKNIIVKAHLVRHDHFRDEIKNNPNTKFIIMIRDPRDTCLSLCEFIQNPDFKASNYIGPLPDEFDTFSSSEKLQFCITKLKLTREYESALEYSKFPNTLLVRFENLVGEKGGGSYFLQKQELLKIVNFLKIHIKNKRDKIKSIQKKLFGRTWSFNKGIIGRHKQHFTEMHYEIFEKVFSDLLEPLSKWYDFTRN